MAQGPGDPFPEVAPMRWFAALLLCLVAASAAAIEPFHAPAVPAGSVDVRLHPTEGVPTGTPVLVTFGLPLPRGSLTAAQLNTVRVLRAGQEIPAHVVELTPWRHRSNSVFDGTSVRVARIQIRHAFGVAFPNSETITVSWGGAPRAQNVAIYTDARTAWHTVTSGSFVAADGVMEPDVFAVLPADWLVRGTLKSSRSTPFDPTNGEARDNPATNDAIATWPDYQEAERALKNNFYSVINRDDPAVTAANQCPYKTSQEPWLYDRAATMFVLYFRSGSFTALREAVRATQFYANRVDAGGSFTLAPGDTKYAYNESMAYAYWAVGDDTLPTRIAQVASAQNGFAHTWTPTRGFWTERHAAYKLLGHVVAYEVLGGATRRDTVNQILADYRAHQDGAGGAIPASRIDGGLYHFGSQHDGDWASGSLGASSWMSALLSDAVVRAYATGEDAATANFMRRLGNFLRATIVTTNDNGYDTSRALALPRYGMLLDGSDGQRNSADVEHALDVAGQIAWADWFARAAGQPDPSLLPAVQALYQTYDLGVNFWIRPTGPSSGLPAYRVSPWRKWGWEHRTSDGIAFAQRVGGGNPGGGADVLFANSYE
jgi:hypothetical protein